MGKLVLFLQDGSTKAINLGKERVVIGRRADNDVCLPYPAVSGEHVAVVTILADSFLEDLGSTNGTLVNGAVVQKHFLRDRDQIDIGQQKLVYLADESAQLEDLNINVVRKELKTFGEKVEPALNARRARDAASDIDADLAGDVAQAKPRKTLQVPAERSAAPEEEKLAPSEDTVPPPGNASASSLPDIIETRADKRARRPVETKREVTPVAKGKDPANIGVEVVLDGDPLGERASTDRGLANMAKLRAEPAASHAAASVEIVPSAEAELLAKPRAPVERVAPARITVLSGASAGRSLIIENDEVVVGRVGLQVAAIGRGESGYNLRLREGGTPPMLNGAAVAADGAMLKSGDIFEVAGTRVEFIAGK